MKAYKAIAEYYDAENERTLMLEQDVPFFLAHLGTRPRQVLEIAAGTGRAAIPIAQAGHRVTATDYAPDMLRIARRKRDAVGLPDARLRLVEADALTMRLRRRFDWVCIFYNTFLNFTTPDAQDAVMRTVLAHLKPGGHFWLDVFQPNLSVISQELTTDLAPTLFWVPSMERTVLKTTTIRCDPAAQRQEVTFEYQWFDRAGRPKRRRTHFTLTFMFPHELHRMVRQQGLQVQAMYGDYDGSSLDADSPRIILHCRRPL